MSNSFWDIDQYRIIIERMENGFKSCDDFMSMVQERGEIELMYAQKLRRWEGKWSNALKKGYEYGSTLDALRCCIKEAGQIADLHEECRMKLIGDGGPFSCMYRWKRAHCHKTIFGGVQEIRQFEEDFSNAQSGYMKLLSKIKKARKAYHTAVVAAHKTQKFAEEESKKEIVGTETKNKLFKRAEELAKHRESMKKVYLKGILMCNGKMKERYFQKMTSQFHKCQLFEKERLESLKYELLRFVNALDISVLPGYDGIYEQIKNKIESACANDDVEIWSEKHGASMKPYWPSFEEFNLSHLDEDKAGFNGLFHNETVDKDDHWYDCFESDFEDQELLPDQTWKEYVAKQVDEAERKRVSQNLALSAVQQRLLSLAHKKATQQKPSASSTQASSNHGYNKDATGYRKPNDKRENGSHVFGQHSSSLSNTGYTKPNDKQEMGSHVFGQHSSSLWSTDTGSANNATNTHSRIQSRVLSQGRQSEHVARDTGVVQSCHAVTQSRETRDTGQRILDKADDPMKSKQKSHRNLLLQPPDQTEHRVQALWNFEPGQHDELALMRGEVFFQLGQTNEDGWAYGRIGSRTGLFPAGYVRVFKPEYISTNVTSTIPVGSSESINNN